jgi:alanyl-tRNA synthetase
MTDRLYHHDACLKEFDAQVLGCTPEADHYHVVLDRTAFYAASGGQPHDTGSLGAARVLEVIEAGDDTIVHVTDRHLSPGVVHGAIDWPRRFDHMQQHTGQHLLSAVFLERFRLRTVSFHLGKEVSTIDLATPAVPPEHLREAEQRVNELICEDRAVTVRFGTREELAAAGVRKEVDREGILRAIEIEGVECQPCGGTHVARTGQVGLLLLRKCEKQRGNWRVEFVCGFRALNAARQDAAALGEAARLLACAPAEVSALAGRLLEERRDSQRSRQRLLERLAELEAAELHRQALADAGGVVRVVHVLDGADAVYLRLLATALVAPGKVQALLATRPGGQVVFAHSPGLPGDMNALLRDVLREVGGKGGGTRDFAQGSCPGSTDPETLVRIAAARLAS